MNKKQLNLTYALKNGEIISISDVESGLKCECICPSCGESLVAKKGSKMMHHFAHHSGHTCEYGYETSLHFAAKEIISKAKKFTIPDVYLHFPDSYKKDELIHTAQEVIIDKVELEQHYNGIIPDIVLHINNKVLFVEVYVTHSIDEKKLEKLKSANISTIEIDLSKKKETITNDELENILLNNSTEKKWKYNVLAQKYLQQFYDIAEYKSLTYRGFALHIDYCPIKTRIYKGKPYANFIDDCLNCEYCIFVDTNAGILCSGKERISTLKDFDIPKEQRIRDSEDLLGEIRDSSVAAGSCPYCGCRLVERHGKRGDFLGCSNYPHCTFSCDKN